MDGMKNSSSYNLFLPPNMYHTSVNTSSVIQVFSFFFIILSSVSVFNCIYVCSVIYVCFSD